MCVLTPLSCPTPLLWIHFVSVRASILFYSHRNHPIMESTLPAYQFYANLLTKYSSTIKGTRGGKLKATQPHHWLFDCRELTGKRFSWGTGQLHKAARTVHTTAIEKKTCANFCDQGFFYHPGPKEKSTKKLLLAHHSKICSHVCNLFTLEWEGAYSAIIFGTYSKGGWMMPLKEQVQK